jgi:hypothetical protein
MEIYLKTLIVLFVLSAIERFIFLCDGAYPRQPVDRSVGEDAFAMLFYIGLAVWAGWVLP